MKQIIIIIVFIFYTNISAQLLHLKNYTTNEGLPSSQVWCILQDSKGYIWFGTSGGLVKYNGRKLITFSVEDGLCNNRIRSILEDDNGYLWLTTNNGISRFDGFHFTNYTSQDGLGKGIVWTSAKYQGYLWFGTSEDGLSRFDGKQFVYFTTEDGLPHNYINELFTDDEFLWIGTLEGLSRYNGTQFVNFDETDGIPAKTISTFVKTDSALWVGARIYGLFQYRNNRFSEVAGYQRYDLYSAAASNENVWIGTVDDGVLHFENGFQNYTKENGLLDDIILSVFIDKENTVWFGTNKGISKLISQKFTSYLENKKVLSVMQYKNQIWLGTASSGLFKLSDETPMHIPIKGRQRDYNIWALTVFQNKLWIGAYEGLYSFNGKGFQSYVSKNGAPHDAITDLLPMDNHLWIASREGLFRYDGEEFTIFTDQDGLISNNIKKLCRDENNIWIATEGGASCFNGKRFKNYTTEQGLSSNHLKTVFKDQNGTLWFGTDLGLNRYESNSPENKEPRFTVFTTRDGLSNNNVSSILESSGNLYLGTDKGLNIFNGEKIIKIYNSENGLIGNELTNHNALYNDHKGNIWYGTSNGITKYMPSYDMPNRVPPDIHIERFFVNDSLISTRENLMLTHRKNNIKFSFVGLSFKDEDNVHYKYQLEGYDKHWSEITQETEVRYTNLNNGHYAFKVLACNEDGYWSIKPAEFSFRILPPLWETWWFRSIAICTILFIMIYSYKKRINQIEKRKKELEIQVKEKTDAAQALQNALSEVKRLKSRLQAENVYLQKEINLEHNFDNIITNSNAFKKILQQLEQVASTDSTVLIIGETGTGKELLARAIHSLSKRNNSPLIKVDCAALPPNLIESELFGHEKGAFTGAMSRKLGRFEIADKGTIFLDEIGEMPPELQIKLLRVLQEREIQRIGSNQTIQVDVRVIAATNRNLEEEITKGNFREDLFFRLNVFPIHIPPLRERKDDIPLLVKYFVKKYNTKLGGKVENIPQSVIDTLQDYHWPGNVRELENIIQRAIILSQNSKLFLGDWIQKNSTGNNHTSLKTLEENERRYILKVLKTTEWRVSGEKGAAKILNVNPKTLFSRIEKLGIHRKE